MNIKQNAAGWDFQTKLNVLPGAEIIGSTLIIHIPERERVRKRERAQ